MITRSVKIRRRLRSARVSALSEDERRAEMRAGEHPETVAPAQGGEHEDGAGEGASAVPPRIAGV